MVECLARDQVSPEEPLADPEGGGQGVWIPPEKSQK